MNSTEKSDCFRQNIQADGRRVTLVLEPFAKFMRGKEVDTAAVAFLLDKSGMCREEDFLFWGTMSVSGIRHRGDKCMYSFGGDEFDIYPKEIEDHVEKVIFAYTADSSLSPGHTLASLRSLQMSLFKTPNLRNRLADFGENEMGNAQVMQVAELVRTNDGWSLEVVSRCFDGGLADVCAKFGIEVV